MLTKQDTKYKIHRRLLCVTCAPECQERSLWYHWLIKETYVNLSFLPLKKNTMLESYQVWVEPRAQMNDSPTIPLGPCYLEDTYYLEDTIFWRSCHRSFLKYANRKFTVKLPKIHLLVENFASFDKVLLVCYCTLTENRIMDVIYPCGYFKALWNSQSHRWNSSASYH